MKIGDRVVCINDSNQIRQSHGIPGENVIKDEEYIIRAIFNIRGISGVWLEDIIGGYGYLGVELCYKTSRFRLIDEQNFTNALTKKLANDAMKELKEYVPLEVEPSIPFTEEILNGYLKYLNNDKRRS